MSDPEERHFALVWAALIVGAIVISLPLHLPWWDAFAHDLGFLLFGAFWGTETAAGGLPPGQKGTMTNWIYRKIKQTAPRMAVGVWLSCLLMWRVNLWVGLVFLAWLPIHYWHEGKPGPVDNLLRWIGHRFGVGIRTY